MNGFLYDDNGNRSSMRLFILIILLVQVIRVVTWSYVCMTTKTLIPMDFWGDVVTVLGSLWFKSTQKKEENNAIPKNGTPVDDGSPPSAS